MSAYSKAIAGGVITSALVVIAHFAGATTASFVESAILPIVTVLGIAFAPANKK